MFIKKIYTWDDILKNKAENKKIEEEISYETHKFGKLDQLLISAEHRIGISDVKSKITEIILNKDLKQKYDGATENNKKYSKNREIA